MRNEYNSARDIYQRFEELNYALEMAETKKEENELWEDIQEEYEELDEATKAMDMYGDGMNTDIIPESNLKDHVIMAAENIFGDMITQGFPVIDWDQTVIDYTSNLTCFEIEGINYYFLTY